MKKFHINNGLTYNIQSYSYPGGGIGRHAGLKILWLCGCTGSSPVPGTNYNSQLSCKSKIQQYLDLKNKYKLNSIFFRNLFLVFTIHYLCQVT